MRLPLCLLPLLLTAAQAAESYRYTVDLTATADDRFHVELLPPTLPPGQAVFHLAATAPGTYQVHDWGRLVGTLAAFDGAGQALAVERQGDNRFVIAEGGRIARLAYDIDDALGTELGARVIYPMAATSIEPDNAFINPFGLFGWFGGHDELRFETTYLLPEGWTAVSALPPAAAVAGRATFVASDYDQLADSPVMAGRIEIEQLAIDRATVTFASYQQQGGQMSALALKRTITPVVEATRRWLGHLPAERYAFLVHARTDIGFLFGALEHWESSFYYVPEGLAKGTLKMIAAHEFFHIVTPLNIHSEVIADFDFAEPRPTRHLWLFEGLTEYASLMIMRKGGLIGDPTLADKLREKFMMQAMFPMDVPLTELSLGCLGPTKSQYQNIYARGALTVMGLDLELLRLSDGRIGLRELVLAMLERYGRRRPFSEDALFDDIAGMTVQAIRGFFARHVEGAEPLDWDTLLGAVGYRYDASISLPAIADHWPPLKSVDGDRVVVGGAPGEAVEGGFLGGDLVLSIDGIAADRAHWPAVRALAESLVDGQVVAFRVERDGMPVDIAVTATQTERWYLNHVHALPEATPDQLRLRRKWLEMPDAIAP